MSTVSMYDCRPLCSVPVMESWPAPDVLASVLIFLGLPSAPLTVFIVKNDIIHFSKYIFLSLNKYPDAQEMKKIFFRDFFVAISS